MTKAKNSSFLPPTESALLFLGWRLLLASSAVAKSIASAFDLDDFGVVEEAVQNGGGRWNVVEQLAPFLDGPIGGHEGGAGFVTAHDDLQEHFSGFGRQDFEPHVIDEQQIGFEIAGQGAIQLGRGLIGLKFPNHVEDRPVENLEAGFNGMVADGLSQVALTQTRRPDQQHVTALADELAGSQVVDLLAFDGRIEGPVKVFEGFGIAEGGGFGPFGDQTLMPDVEFILKDQFEELFMGQLMGAGFLQAQLQAGQEAGETQLTGVLHEVLVHRLVFGFE